MRYVLLLLILVASSAGGIALEARAQLAEKEWQSLGTFPRGVECIYFLDLPGPPRIGFLGDTGNVFRTTDGGVTWVSVQDNDSILPSDFTFANSDTGWFTNYIAAKIGHSVSTAAPAYKTTDGGLSWAPLVVPAPVPTSIYYNRSNGLLLLSAWDGAGGGELCSSTDGGTTWSVLAKGDPYNGFAFMNGDSGIVTERETGAYRTTNGGLSWAFATTVPYETWQANADTVRRVIWESCENRPSGTSNLFQTTDFGVNFSLVGTIPAITGTMREGSCGTLYMQTTSAADKGTQSILRSTDGVNWIPLRDLNGNAGPANLLDTRFYVKGDFIFAGGIAPGDDTARLWRYVEDSTKYGGDIFTAPVVSTKDFHMISTSCLDLDSSVYVIYFDDCVPAILVSANLAPTPRFALNLRDSLPHEASGYYPVTIEHIPNGRSFDTTELYLHYYADGQDFFDTVLVSAQLLGADVAAPFDIVVNDVKNATVAGGDTVRFTIRLTDSIPARVGLDSISFSTSFDGNVLSYQSAKAIAPWTMLDETHGEGTTRVTLRPPPGVMADANTAIANIFYIADVAPNASTSYVLSDILLNNVSFDGCAGIASLPVPPVVTVAGCGDSILRNVMAGEPIVQLLDIEDLGGEISIHLRSSEDIPLEFEVYNEIGKPMQRFSFFSKSGEYERVPVPASGLPNGLYFISIRSGSDALAAEHFMLRK